MALVDLVKARYSAQSLIEWTNPNAPAAVVIDDARLSAAAADAAGDFLTFVGIALDLANTAHVGIAVRLVHTYLLYYADPANRFADLQTAQQGLSDRRALIGAGVRVGPVTDSVLTPSHPDTSSGQPVRPYFDPANFQDVIPGILPTDPNS